MRADKMQDRFAVTIAPRGILYEKPGDPEGGCGHEFADELLSGWAVEILEENSSGWMKVRTLLRKS